MEFIMQYKLFGDKDSDICLVQMVDRREEEVLQKEYDLITGHYRNAKPLLVAVMVKDWNKDLSPWEAPPAFGKEPFGGGGRDTLNFILEELLPEIRKQYFPDKKDVKIVIGGYSLAGLFALWSVYQTDVFSGCVAASPSVWFQDWIGYAQENKCLTDTVYLSLGKKEPKTKNPVMRTVGDCIEKQAELLIDKNVIFEWNEGNHFKDPDVRMAKGFVWTLSR